MLVLTLESDSSSSEEEADVSQRADRDAEAASADPSSAPSGQDKPPEKPTVAYYRFMVTVFGLTKVS